MKLNYLGTLESNNDEDKEKVIEALQAQGLHTQQMTSSLNVRIYEEV